MTKRDEAIEAIQRAILGRTATASAPDAFDAVIRVLMEPDKTMIAAGRREVRAFDHRFDEGEVAAERTLQAMLKEAAK